MLNYPLFLPGHVDLKNSSHSHNKLIKLQWNLGNTLVFGRFYQFKRMKGKHDAQKSNIQSTLLACSIKISFSQFWQCSVLGGIPSACFFFLFFFSFFFLSLLSLFTIVMMHKWTIETYYNSTTYNRNSTFNFMVANKTIAGGK